MSDRLWTIFAELAKHYHKVSCEQRGFYFVVHVVHKGKSASVSDFETGWWLGLSRESDSVVDEKAIETVDELLITIRKWLDE
jgi:hypothetical protein